MENKFKNPFEIDDESLQMISLQTNKQSMQSINSHKPNFASPVEPSVSQPLSKPDLTVSEESMFDVLAAKVETNNQQYSSLNEDDDPPLLQDIGIDIQLIKKRVVAILTFKGANEELIRAPDLSGPILISLSLGFVLLLGGKMHFSDIETAFIVGNILLYFLFNYMNKNVQSVPLYNIMSFLGYSLLPMLFLGFAGLMRQLSGVVGVIFGCLFAGWSAFSCSSLLGMALRLETEKMLIAYPLFLFYLSFSLMIIF